MKIEPAEFLERLNRGESPEAIISSTRPSGQRELLRRLAVVSTFNRELFDTVLSPSAGDGAPAFDEIVQTAQVEALPRREGVFQLRRAERSSNWRAWWEDGPTDATAIPAPLRALLRRLAEYYAAHSSRLDLLAQLSLLDPTAAGKLFEELYLAADERFNLAGCQDLIDVLSDPDRVAFLDPKLIARRNDRDAYLRARSLWSTEYYKTARFLEPAGVRELYEEFLNGERGRALDLHAPGGRGKTIQLRWLFSRQLVPEPGGRRGKPLVGGRIPCVKLDFDVVDPVNATRYPWLGLLEAAAQLNQQLPMLPFNELLERYGWAIPLLRRNPADPSRVETASKRMRSEGQDAAKQVVRRFSRTLNEAVGDVPVVLVLDTLEEVHLRPQGDLKSALQMLGRLLDFCPGIRLILSGRYSVREVLGDAAGGLPRLENVEVKLFTKDEAQRYLEQLREIEDSSIRDAIVEKAHGDAFVLSLLADIVQEGPSLSPAEIGRYPADAVRLIRKVIERIAEPGVHWLLRYGVIPRDLTPAFIRDVMQPYLRDAMAGASHDDPDKDEIPRVAETSGQRFRTDLLESPESPLDLEKLWTQLRRYAGSTSWVYELPGEEVALRFRSDVVVPMRRIIRERKEVFDALHSDAAAYFEQKARDEPQLWERWTREALYHRFQLEGAAAARVWRRAIDAAGDDPDRREALASELLEPDYVDETGSPLPWSDDEPIVTRRTLVEAAYERARALTELARARRVGPDDRLWSLAEQSLQAVERGQQELGGRIVAASGFAYIRAGLALKDRRFQEAESELRRALRSTRRGIDTIRLRTLLGDAQLAGGNRAAIRNYERALEAVGTLKVGGSWKVELGRKLVQSRLEFDQLRECAKDYRRTLEAAQLPEERGELLILGSRLALRTGQVQIAEETARAAWDEMRSWESAVPLVSAVLTGLEPRRALLLALEADQTGTGASSTTPNSSAQAAWARELVGMCRAALMQFEESVRALESARRLWKSEGDVEGVGRCYARSATLALREVGDLKLAEHHLNEAEQLTLPIGGDAWLDTRLLMVELLQRKGMSEAAAHRVQLMVDRLQEANAVPRKLIRTALGGLAFGSPDTRLHLLRLLVEQCKLVTPATARIVLLQELRQVPELGEGHYQVHLNALRQLLRIGVDADLSGRDRSLLTVTLAELDRIGGKDHNALGKLSDALPGLRVSETTFFVREWALACDRLGDRVSKWGAPKDDEQEEFVSEFGSDSPMLCAVFLTERAEAALNKDPRIAASLLDRAEEMIARAPEGRTQWHARLQRARAAVGQRLTVDRLSRHIATGAALFHALGDLLNSALADAEFHNEPLAELEQGTARAIVQSGPNGLSVERRIPPAFEEEVTVSQGDRMWRFLETWVRQPGPDLSSYELEDWCTSDLNEVGRELGTLLFSPAAWDAVLKHDSPVNVRLEIEGRRLNAVPWELARGPRHGNLLTLEPGLRAMWRATSKDAAAREATRFLQVALNRVVDGDLAIDGDFGPASGELLRHYQERRHLASDGIVREETLSAIQTDLANDNDDRPLAILVQASTHRQFMGSRGKATVGTDLISLYESSGFEVWQSEEPSVDELGAMLFRSGEKRVPAVLHLSGGLRESGGEVALNFLAGEWYSEALAGSRSTDDLPVTALQHLLSPLPADSFRPLVILDIDRPPGNTEALAQLSLRNAFAADLFGLGRCPAVIATGLANEEARWLYGVLVQSLGSGATLAETCTKIRQLAERPDLSREEFDGALSLTGTALFTDLPWLRPVPR